MKFFCWGLIISVISTQVFAEELRDPTRPDNFTANSSIQGPLELNAIIVSADRQVAVINGVVVKVGDDVGGARVLSISPNKVQLQGASDKITLFLLDQSLKQPVSGY